MFLFLSYQKDRKNQLAYDARERRSKKTENVNLIGQWVGCRSISSDRDPSVSIIIDLPSKPQEASISLEQVFLGPYSIYSDSCFAPVPSWRGDLLVSDFLVGGKCET